MSAPVTAVEAARAGRRWLTVPLTLLVALALVLGLVVLAAGAVLLHRYSCESTPHYADDVSHFRYGSIGADRSSGLPYRIRKELPVLFPEVFRPALDRGDGAYAAFGFLYERHADARPSTCPWASRADGSTAPIWSGSTARFVTPAPGAAKAAIA